MNEEPEEPEEPELLKQSEQPEQQAASKEIGDDQEDHCAGTTSHSNVEDQFERYRKMLKMGVPRPAVEDRMLKDGISAAELDRPVVEAIVIEQLPESIATVIAVPTTRRRRWHLAEVPKADRAPPPLNGSIWTRVDEENAHQRVTAASQAHIRSLFVRDIDNPVESTEPESAMSDSGETSTFLRPSGDRKKGKVQVMKGNKAVALELAVRHISKPFAEVAKDVNILTAMYLQDTNIRTMLSMWPNKAEQIALDEYSDEFEALGRCEQFLVTIRAVPMAKEKLHCLVLKMEIASRAEHVKQSVGLVTRALNQVCSSSKFTTVIRLLRDFSNLVNEEFVTNYKTRFSLESLLKMNHTKAFDSKTTTIFDGFLDVLRTEQDGTLVNFYEEINLVMQCKSVSVAGLLSEVKQLHEGYQLVKLVAVATGNSPNEDAELAQAAFNQFAEEINDMLRGIQARLDDMEASQCKFVSWFEENPNVPLDQHLKAVAQFASDVKDRFAALNWPAARI
ncbi:putative aarF domain-containing protein kinase 4 [Phytophthora pseudosyringae]|uniref:Putative aarF domain-containing protein kinase 4 n=1 Tax=Phytophthora pseudosyringae TaxID=221518 RepID=A0A8T1W9J6_9STRA|nr:putative aarF domain-containing protein kinase 4 [Phytophthora pseudosyringae]